uniref:Nuclear receptor-binding protein 2-like n=1 Tax=Sinocyclocheilus rhinocerous TaxID=307959 RepID=A0A673GTA7_9TELE
MLKVIICLPLQVSQGNVPGVESASLAMDTEEGVEVVWNEVLFQDKKVFKTVEDKMKEMFENLMQVDHPNIVKFHKYWLDIGDNHARVVFITEYMSSGSLKQFLKKTKKNHKSMNVKAWKRWCTQILSALSYLHSCDPPIIHGNLTCDTIFIQHNGLIKIGSVWHRLFVNGKRLPKWYILRLMGFQVKWIIIITKIIQFGFYMLSGFKDMLPENCVEEKTKSFDPNGVMAEIIHKDHPRVQLKYSHVSPLELDKFLEDVKNGIYPLMNFASTRPHPVPRALSMSQEHVETVKTPTPEPQEVETRKVVQMHCNLESNEDTTKTHLTLFLKLDDKLHRQLSCDIMPSECNCIEFSSNKEDGDKIVALLEDALNRQRGSTSAITTI